MTLADEVRKIMETKGMSQKQFADDCGINRACLSKGLKTGYFSNISIGRIIEVYGKRFEKYYAKKTCDFCGIEFIPMLAGRKCCTQECSTKMNNRLTTERDNRNRAMRKAAGETKAERYKWRAKVRPAKVSIVEFMDGQSYADRQKQYLLSLQKEQRMEIR